MLTLLTKSEYLPDLLILLISTSGSGTQKIMLNQQNQCFSVYVVSWLVGWLGFMT